MTTFLEPIFLHKTCLQKRSIFFLFAILRRGACYLQEACFVIVCDARNLVQNRRSDGGIYRGGNSDLFGDGRADRTRRHSS